MRDDPYGLTAAGNAAATAQEAINDAARKSATNLKRVEEWVHTLENRIEALEVELRSWIRKVHDEG